MKKFLMLLLIAAAAALAIWFGMRGGSAKISSSAATSLLPKGTLVFLHLPDLNGIRADWRGTDLYKLWREPAVQDFLQKPIAKMPEAGAARQKLQELDALEIKDAFFALVSWENKQSKLLAGFRFKGSATDAEKVIGKWRERARAKTPAATRETVTYEQHQIELTTQDAFTIATVYDGQWFFAGNDLATLKVLLDRADHRLSDAAGTLAADETFIAATKHMPKNYGARGYGRLDRYFEKLAQSLPPQPENVLLALLRQIKSVSAATTVDGGKIRDVAFVAMPKIPELGNLTRESLTLATRDSFLYLASMINLPNAMPGTLPGAPQGYPAPMQKLFATLAANGITLESWKNTFGAEFGIIGAWPAGARLPSVFATLPVKDAARASEMLGQFTAATGDEQPWAKTEADGVQYYSKPPVNPMVPVAPTIALSSQRLLLGLDNASLAAAVKRGAAKESDLQNSETYKKAERVVGAPTYSFTYLDTALLYGRLDAALRPMLVMAAAFVPSVAETVDLGKLPPPEVITKHLSPIVVSQNFETDGYVMESVGPVSIYQGAVGLAVTTGLGANLYQTQLRNLGPTSVPAASPAPSPGASPDDSPDDQ